MLNWQKNVRTRRDTNRFKNRHRTQLNVERMEERLVLSDNHMTGTLVLSSDQLENQHNSATATQVQTASDVQSGSLQVEPGQTPRPISPTLVVITHGQQIIKGGRYDFNAAKGDWLAGADTDSVNNRADDGDDWVLSLAAKVEQELQAQSSDMPIRFLVTNWDTFGQNDIPADKLAEKILKITSSTKEKWDVIFYGHSRGAIFNHKVLDKLGENANIDYVQTVMLDPTASKLHGDQYPKSKHWLADSAVNYNDGHKFGTGAQKWEHLMPQELLADRMGRKLSDLGYGIVGGALSFGVVPIVQNFQNNLIEDGFDIEGTENHHIHDEMHRDMKRFDGDVIVDSLNDFHGLSQHMKVHTWYENSHYFGNDLADFLAKKDGGHVSGLGASPAAVREIQKVRSQKIILQHTVEYILNVAKDFAIGEIGKWATGQFAELDTWAQVTIGAVGTNLAGHYSGLTKQISGQLGNLSKLSGRQNRALGGLTYSNNRSLSLTNGSQSRSVNRSLGSKSRSVSRTSNRATRSLANSFKRALSRAASAAKRTMSRAVSSAKRTINRLGANAKRALSRATRSAKNAMKRQLRNARKAMNRQAALARKAIRNARAEAKNVVRNQRQAAIDQLAKVMHDALKNSVAMIANGASAAEVQAALKSQMTTGMNAALANARSAADQQIGELKQSAGEVTSNAKNQMAKARRNAGRYANSRLSGFRRAAGRFYHNLRRSAGRVASKIRSYLSRVARSAKRALSRIVYQAKKKIRQVIRKIQAASAKAREAVKAAWNKVRRSFRW